MKLFSVLFMSALLMTGFSFSEETVTTPPTKTNCHCINCACTPESNCGCYSNAGCKCSKESSCCGQKCENEKITQEIQQNDAK